MCSAFGKCAVWSAVLIGAFAIFLHYKPQLSASCDFDSQRFDLFVFLKKTGPSSFASGKEEPCKVTHDSLETGSHTVGIPFQTMSMGRNRLFPVKCVSLLCFEGSQDMGKIMQGSHRLEKTGTALFAACTKPKAYGKTLGNCLWYCKEDLNALKMEKESNAVGYWLVVVFAACEGGQWHGVHRPFCFPWFCSAGTAQHSTTSWGCPRAVTKCTLVGCAVVC